MSKVTIVITDVVTEHGRPNVRIQRTSEPPLKHDSPRTLAHLAGEEAVNSILEMLGATGVIDLKALSKEPKQ